MNPLMRLVAVVGAVAVSAGLVSSCALAGSPAAADPTLESIAPPAPVTVPAVTAPTASAPAASSSAADEAAIRQVVQTYYEAYRAADWDTLLSTVCPASQYRVNDELKATRAQLGPGKPITIKSVDISGDTAQVSAGIWIVTVKRGANGWQLCPD